MGMPYSTEEIDSGMLWEGYDSLEGLDKVYEDTRIQMKIDQARENKLNKVGYGYWLDNCGDDVWYCQHCLQPECDKRMAKRV